MRGRDDRSDGLFSYVRLEERIPADHPLRAVRRLADEALAALNGRFEALFPSDRPARLGARTASPPSEQPVGGEPGAVPEAAELCPDHVLGDAAPSRGGVETAIGTREHARRAHHGRDALDA